MTYYIFILGYKLFIKCQIKLILKKIIHRIDIWEKPLKKVENHVF
jgi:hypothetical protein